MDRVTKYSTVIRCIASFKSKKFESEDEPPQKSKITEQNQKKTLISFLPRILPNLIPYLGRLKYIGLEIYRT